MSMPGHRPRRRPLWQRIGLLLPYAWLVLFFLVPFLIVLKISFSDPLVAQPPFTPLYDPARPAGERLYATLENYRFVLGDRLYLLTYLNSVGLAATATLLCLLLGYPMAWGIARSRPGTRNTLLLLVILPFWTSFLLRVYAWMGILGSHGTMNRLLLWAGVVDRPLQLLYTNGAVCLGMIYSYLPFMILPLYANLVRLEQDLLDAAADLGGRPSRVFLDVILPLSLPGVVAGCLLVFIPAIGEFVIPALLGGSDSLLIGRVVYDEFFLNRDWPVAAAIAVLLLILLVGPIALFQRTQARDEGA